jgi:PAS domain S-box-containing protein
MNAEDKYAGKFHLLRKKAETLVKSQPDKEKEVSHDVLDVIHELEIHQAELTIQNEELLRTQKELSALHEKYKNLYEFAPCGYLTLNNKGIITQANLTSVKMLGMDRGRLLRSAFSSFIAFGYEDDFFLLRKQAAETGEKQSFEVLLRSKKRTPFWAAVEMDADLNEEGELEQWRIILVDVTARRKAEEELRRMQKLEGLGTIAAGIAHDFNNLLAGIFGNIGMARSELPENHDAHSSLQEAGKTLNSARQLTGQLLTFAEGGNPRMEVIDTREFVRQCVQFNLGGSNVRPEFKLPEHLWKMEADKGQLSQVLGNIVINARQAMADGGRLYVSADNVEKPSELGLKDMYGPHVRLSIRDEGSGIPPHLLDRVFDPYFSTRQKGHGLGLAVAHSIITKHKGHISISSEPESGTTVLMILPATFDAATEKAQKESPASKPAAGEQWRILLMDDDPMVRKTTSRILEREGNGVETAANGNEAVEKYESAMKSGQSFDLAILDLTIVDGMGGKDAAKELLAKDPKARLIVFSGYSNDPVIAHYPDYGFMGCLTKPFEFEELMEEISRVMAMEQG